MVWHAWIAWRIKITCEWSGIFSWSLRQKLIASKLNNNFFGLLVCEDDKQLPPLSPTLCKFFCLMPKMPWRCRRYRSWRVMLVASTHPIRCPDNLYMSMYKLNIHIRTADSIWQCSMHFMKLIPNYTFHKPLHKVYVLLYDCLLATYFG